MYPNWEIITDCLRQNTSNIHATSENSLGLCGTHCQTNFVHKKVTWMASNYILQSLLAVMMLQGRLKWAVKIDAFT